MPSASSGVETATLLQRGVDVKFRESARWSKPEEQSRAYRDRDEISKNAVVHGIVEIGTWPLRDYVEAHAPCGNPPAEDPADGREHHALDEELSNDPPAPGTKGDAERHLTGPAHRASQQEIREIGTGDQEHKTNGTPHGPVCQGRVWASEKLVEGSSAGMDALIGQRIGAR